MATAPAINSTLFVPLGTLPPPEVIFGGSDAMRAVHQKVEKLAGANVPVLIQGESGTGKEVIAKLIHKLSPWEEGPFVKVNCPAIPATLLESELFGYERGAFTGAYGTKPGRVELANRGTLFLDEISELEASLQAKLLQLLQDGQFCRIGAQEDRRVEVRLLCATNRQLEEEIDTGSFRQDLYYRINVLNVSLPPLRERRMDIPGLIAYFIDIHAQTYKVQPPPISPQVMQLLQRYDWPGNIRELENLVKRFVILGSEDVITSELVTRGQTHFSARVAQGESVPLKELTRQAVQELERKIILQVLQANHWNRKVAARKLKISYRALLYKIHQAGLPSRSGRKQQATDADPAPEPAN
ncbi:MAG: sigma-54 interaction domain-containing protein [Terriglobia bacterium]